MLLYFALQVRTGSECIVARQIEKAHSKLDIPLIHSILVPKKSKYTFDTIKNEAKNKTQVLLNSYIFITVETNNSDTFHIIPTEHLEFLNKCSSYIHRVIKYNIDVCEIESMVNMDNNKIVEVVLEKDKIEAALNKLSQYQEFIKNKKLFNFAFNFLKQCSNKSKTKITLTLENFINIAEKINLTVKCILYSPGRFIFELINLLYGNKNYNLV